MRRLEGHGHEQRLARAKSGFKRSRVGSRRIAIPRSLRKSVGALGLLVLGAGIGASVLILLEATQQPDHTDREGLLSDGGSYYRSCRDAFQDGRANILRGEPGYRARLDADGDGKACEPYAPMSR
jgi:Excalibur calcium-binding domain